MPINYFGFHPDENPELVSALERMQADHPKADITLKQTQGCVVIRVIDKAFAGVPLAARLHQVWDYISNGPEDLSDDVLEVLPLTPSELKKSVNNFYFENPIIMTWEGDVAPHK